MSDTNDLNVQDMRIISVESLKTPQNIASLYPISDELQNTIRSYRRTVVDILRGRDERLLAIVGPCSIHDVKAALEYAEKLKKLSEKVSDTFFVVMRTYFEKPRTTVGWKGLIVDPDLDNSCNIEKGLMMARKLLLDISAIGLPVGCETLDPIVPQYIDEILSWASIGARTSESQVHRSIASGLSVPIGFKNSTSGDLSVAINAIRSAASPASFIGVERNGQNAVFRTKGNDCCHLILRGGDHGPNYYDDDVEEAVKMMDSNHIQPAIVIDCSHANCRKDFTKQKRVLRSVVDQVRWGNRNIKGFMLESNLEEGNQKLLDDKTKLKYGVSVTDPCIGWTETERILMHAADLLRYSRREGGFIDVL